ncbi:MAG: hypothetical protein ABEK17_00945 [Candidatus Aenigmatarchaeota archaeon]
MNLKKYRGDQYQELVESEETVVYHTDVFKKEVTYLRKNELED